MPKDDERKEMTQEELDAREEKFRTFFTTSVAQVPEEMTRRDDENEEKPKSLLGRLFRREKGEQQEGGTPEESRTGEIQLGGEEPEEPSDLSWSWRWKRKSQSRSPSSRSQPSRSAPPSLSRKSPKSPQDPSKRRSRLLPSRRKSRQKSRPRPGKRRSSTSRAPRRSSTRTGRCRRSKPCCLVQSFRRRRKSLPSR